MDVKISDVGVNKKEVFMRNFLLYFSTFIGAVLLVFCILTYLRKWDAEKNLLSAKEDASKGWTYEDQSAVDFNKFTFKEDGTMTIRTDIPIKDIGSRSLNFYSTNVVFTVLVNNNAVYDYHPQIKSYSGTTYGGDIHAVNLKLDQYMGEKNYVTIAIRLEVCDDSMPAYFQKVTFEDGNIFISDLVKSELWKFCLALILFVAGLIMVMVGTLFEHNMERRIEIASLGAVIMDMAIWTESGSMFMKYLTGNPGMVRCLNYVSLMFLAFPAITLVNTLARHKSKLFPTIIGLLTLANMVLHLVLVPAGTDYSKILIFTHITILLAIAGALYVSIKGMKDKEVPANGFVLIGFAILVASGVFDMLNFYTADATDPAKFARIGLMIFVILLSIFEIREFIKLGKINRENDEIEELVHKDELTGLENKQSYKEYKLRNRNRENGALLMVTFGMEGLDAIETTLGKGAREAMFVAGTDVIDRSFGEKGKVYNLGKERVIAIFDEESIGVRAKNLTVLEQMRELRNLYKDTEADMIDKLHELNFKKVLPSDLSIVDGVAEYNYIQGSMDETEFLSKKAMEAKLEA